MLHKVTHRSLVVAACGALLACNAAALTLGPARGAVLVGRPLEISIPVMLKGPAPDAPCPSADVYYGQARVAGGVTVRWQPGAGDQGVLHVTSGTPIDEPSVTVDVRAGCGQPTTRHFVLLAQVPPNDERAVVAVPATTAEQPTVPGTPVPRPVAATRPDAPVRPVAGGTRRVAAPAPRAAAPAPTVPAAAPVATAAEPHLQIEPADLAEGGTPLQLTSELAGVPAADPQRRAEAAVLWATLQKTPEERLQDTQRVQALQRELQAVRETTRENAQAAAQMRAQVEQARNQRTGAAWLVGVLTAAFAALLAWVLWRAWRAARVEHVNRWFDAHSDFVRQPLAAGDSQPASVAPSFLPSVPDTTPGEAHSAAPARASIAPRARPPTAAPEEYSPSRGPLRIVGVEELIDVQDKVDFFVSLGQVEQAIAVLEAHVHDQVETSPLPWLDLLQLYHRGRRRADFERLRAEFREHYSAQVPAFEHFGQPTASLENYSRALSRIVALWPSRRVLDVIEESIFRKPGLPGAEPFSLEAYRELVLLFHIASEVVLPEAPARGERFTDTALQPLNLPAAAEGAAHGEDLLLPPSSVRIGVDIDLGDPGDLSRA